jgi:hypothetical protein
MQARILETDGRSLFQLGPSSNMQWISVAQYAPFIPLATDLFTNQLPFFWPSV